LQAEQVSKITTHWPTPRQKKSQTLKMWSSSRTFLEEERTNKHSKNEW
jgi:hypothetical protein